jgi:hypothetical protein
MLVIIKFGEKSISKYYGLVQTGWVASGGGCFQGVSSSGSKDPALTLGRGGGL